MGDADYVLPYDTLQRVVDEATEAHLDEPELRDLLLGGVSQALVPRLKLKSSPRAQLEHDVLSLARVTTPIGDEVLPFERWLRNAIRQAEPLPQARALAEILATLRAAAETAPMLPPVAQAPLGARLRLMWRTPGCQVSLVVIGVACLLIYTWGTDEPGVSGDAAPASVAVIDAGGGTRIVRDDPRRDALLAELAVARARLEVLDNRVASLEERVGVTRERLAMSKRAAGQADRRLAALRAQVPTPLAELQQARADVAQARARLEDDERGHAAAVAHRDSVSKELAAARAVFDARGAAVAAELEVGPKPKPRWREPGRTVIRDDR